MQANLTEERAHYGTPPKPQPLRPADGVLVLSGYGLRVSVHRRHLSVSDGVGRDRRRGALHRATARLRRLVILGHSGLITLGALSWLHDVGASFAQIDLDGRLVASFAPMTTNDVRLRRGQALAATNGVGLAVAKDLIEAKLDAQLHLLERSVSDASDARREITAAKDGVRAAQSDEELRWCESVAASAYWNALAPTPIRFVQKESRLVPEHWRTLGARHSPLSGGSYKAITPANAMLNYLYALLEAEARIAALSAGLDPEMGLFHSLKRFRSSFAHDVMEPVRPAVDAYVLELLKTRVFSIRDFVETREGSCRLTPDFARVLANTSPLWAARVAPVVRQVAGKLLRSEAVVRASAVPPPHRAGALHRLTPRGSLKRPAIVPARRCVRCGGALRTGKTYCPTCAKLQQAESAPRLQVAGPTALVRMRAKGRDRTNTPEARGKRSGKAARRHWENRLASGRIRTSRSEREEFRTRILPRLASIPLRALVDATGLSKPHCSMIKRGLRVPHPRHWPALQLVSGGS